jgi:dipeptidyl aminopeptidase/acylaminoacyl peptidase
MLTRDRAPAALTPPVIRPGRGGSRAGFGSLALALALAALGQSTGPLAMAAPRAASRAASLPPYYIEALRARRYPGGRLALGASLRRGAGFTVYRMSWPSGGQTMTGSIEIPTGRGPFPVVLVAHGYVAPAAYVVGLDSWRYGDALAAHGFIVAAPDYPGHAGSGPGPAGLPAVVGIAVAALDLVSSLHTLRQVDARRLAVLGHSQGGGVALLAMVIDPRIRAVALFAPDSSDMADNARRWWAGDPAAAGPLGTPDQNPAGYAHVSPRRYFRRGQPPVLLVQGTADEQIPAAWTTATYRALRRAGVTTRLVWIPGAPHIMAGADLAGENAAAEAWIRHALGSGAAGAAAPRRGGGA